MSDFVLFAAASDSQPAIEDAQQQQEEGSADACDEFGGYDSDVFDAMRQDSQSVIDDAMAARHGGSGFMPPQARRVCPGLGARGFASFRTRPTICALLAHR